MYASSMAEKDVQVKAEIPRSEKRILWNHLFDKEMTFRDWLRNQISKMNGRGK